MAVTNDLVSDNRIHKMALTLLELGYLPVLAGRKKPQSPPIGTRPYKTLRFRLPFHKGPLFYTSYNIWLLIFLLFQKKALIWSNDLDTLPACLLAARIKGQPLVYDSHELFTEVPELVHRKKVQGYWQRLEARMLPRLSNAITVCQSIADYYEEKYGIKFRVIRNVPFRDLPQAPGTAQTAQKQPIILYQGAVNLGRGIEEAILAMHQLDQALLMIIGEGDHYELCQSLIQREKLSDRVVMTGRVPLEQLPNLTRQATIGLSLEQDLGLNYRYALPNKLFDYIRAEVPVLTSDLPEIRKIVENYQVGITLPHPSPDTIAATIRLMLNSPGRMAQWKDNCRIAAADLCWENEKSGIIELMNTIVF